MLCSCGGDDPVAPVTPDEPQGPEEPGVEAVETIVGTFSFSDVIGAAAYLYDEWEATAVFPQSVTLGEVSLTQPQYLYAMCMALSGLSAGDTGEIKVLDFEAADSPGHDTYDKESIAVSDGAQNGTQTEDLVNVAQRLVKIMKLSGRVPNQTLFTRDGVPVAFGTTRATIAIARALAGYAQSGSLDSEVSVRTKSRVGTIEEFAREFVKILDVWDENVGTIQADSKHSGANAFREVHFIPTYSTNADSDNNKLPETLVTIGRKSFTLDKAWELAIIGIIDMITLEGSSLMQSEIGTPVHTPGDGAAMSSVLYDPSDWDRWGSPWYEADETLNLSADNRVSIPLLERLLPWWYKRANDFGYVGNYQYLESFGVEGYTGMICSMRLLLIMARFYKELLDNNVTENVWTYMKDKTIDPDLYAPKPKEKMTITLAFEATNAVGAVLYKNAYYFPSNAQASVHASYRNDLRIITYDFMTDYEFQLWARYGVSRSTGSGKIIGLRFNPYSSSASSPYGGSNGGGWFKVPAIKGYKLVSVTMTLYSYTSGIGTWNVVSGVTEAADGLSYSVASDAQKFGSLTFSSSKLSSTVDLTGSEYDTPYYLHSVKTYNGNINGYVFEFEPE